MTFKGKLLQNEPMARYTSFRIGGLADYFFIPEDEADLVLGLRWCREQKMPWFILGNGSNILVSDRGIRGMVIHLAAASFRKLSFDGDILTVGAGAKTGTVLHDSANRGLGGIAFLGAIPGTMGGVFYMNGGTYLGEIASVVLEVRFINDGLTIESRAKDALGFAYRKSIFQDHSWVILDGKIKLVRMPKEEAHQKVLEILERRRKTQPLGIPSAGSAFVNPPGMSSWKLIDEAGLRDFSIGDAAVSETHSNFVINKGDAKASEVLQLMRTIQEKVRAKSGILLKPEVRLIGEWNEGYIDEQGGEKADTGRSGRPLE